MSAPDSTSPIWDFLQTGGPYWLGSPSYGAVSIRMNIIFTPMNHLYNKQLPQYELFLDRPINK